MLNEDVGIFGQAGSSQTELKNNNVGPGDLFLFFGWFKNFSIKGRDLHHLFGWLQIREIIEGSEAITAYLKKRILPILMGREKNDTSKFLNNTIYVGKKI